MRGKGRGRGGGVVGEHRGAGGHLAPGWESAPGEEMECRARSPKIRSGVESIVSNVLELIDVKTKTWDHFLIALYFSVGVLIDYNKIIKR